MVNLQVKCRDCVAREREQSLRREMENREGGVGNEKEKGRKREVLKRVFGRA